MKSIKISKVVDLRWSAMALVTVVSLMALGGTLASSASQSGGGSGTAHAASAGAPTGPEMEVKIDNFVFSPGVVTVKAGTQVTWINKDDIPHTVDSTQGKFKSAGLDTDDKFQFKFTEPGEYPFYCRMHPKMTGKIIVQP
jgi:plastocyanin